MKNNTVPTQKIHEQSGIEPFEVDELNLRRDNWNKSWKVAAKLWMTPQKNAFHDDASIKRNDKIPIDLNFYGSQSPVRKALAMSHKQSYLNGMPGSQTSNGKYPQKLKSAGIGSSMMIQQVKINGSRANKKVEQQPVFDNSEAVHKRTLELQAIKSFKRKMKEKRDKAMAELEQFFNRSSSEHSSDDESNEFLPWVEPRRVPIYNKNGTRSKRFGQLKALEVNPLKKINSVPLKSKTPKIRFEDYQITHVIGKGATAVVKLGTHIEKKKNVVFKIYEKQSLNKRKMEALRAEIWIMK